MIRVLVIITDLDPGYPKGMHPEIVNGESILQIITQNYILFRGFYLLFHFLEGLGCVPCCLHYSDTTSSLF